MFVSNCQVFKFGMQQVMTHAAFYHLGWSDSVSVHVGK